MGEAPLSPQQHPWLVIFHGAEKQKQTFFSISEDRYYMRTIPELRNKNILCECSHGWLVLLDSNSGDCYIWNPISNDKIQLPPLPDTGCYNQLQCLLSAPPHEPECSIIFFYPPSSLYFCKPGTTYYHKYDLRPIGGNSILWFWTIFRGKLYGLSSLKKILLLFDLDHDSGIVTPTQLVNQPPDDFEEFFDMPSSASNLIQYNDNDALLYVHTLYHGWQMQEIYGFLVFRFDFTQKAWVKVKSIGETAIFLSNYQGTICSTKATNLKRESIYFTKHQDRRLYVFNLETQSLSLSLPCPHVSRNKNSQFYWLTLAPKSN